MSVPESTKALPQNKRNKGIEMEKEEGKESTDYSLPFVTLGGTVVPTLTKAELLALSSHHTSSL